MSSYTIVTAMLDNGYEFVFQSTASTPRAAMDEARAALAASGLDEGTTGYYEGTAWTMETDAVTGEPYATDEWRLRRRSAPRQRLDSDGSDLPDYLYYYY